MESVKFDLSGFSKTEFRWILNGMVDISYSVDGREIEVSPRYPADHQRVERLMRDVKWEMSFKPIKHRSLVILPYNSQDQDYESIEFAKQDAYRKVAIHMYWVSVQIIMQKNDVDILEARKIMHSQGSLPTRRDQRPPERKNEFWTAEDYIVMFMQQFEDWQQGTYSVREIEETVGQENRVFSWEYGKKKKVSLAQYCTVAGESVRNQFPSFLIHCNRISDAKSLINDPIWGDDAISELENRKFMRSFKRREERRIKESHAHIREIDAIIQHGSPSNYSVHYPYGPYGDSPHTLENPPIIDGKPMKPYHTFENCLCILADGGPVVRFVVLDTDGLTKFKLVDLKNPWWSLYGGIGETPKAGDGEYDFDFPEFNIHEGDEFDYAKMLEVLKHGIARINTRGKRKFNI